MKLRTAVLLTLPPLLWAGNAVVGKLMVGVVPPLLLNALRWWLAAALLLPLGWRVLRRPGRLASHWRYLALLGLLGVGSYNALQYLAVQTSSPLNVTLIAGSMPLWMMAAGALLYGVRPSARQYAGAALSLLGIALVLSRGSWSTFVHIRFVAGDLYILLASALWALYSWMLARPPASMTGASQPPWNWAEALLAQILFGLAWASVAAGAEHALAPVTLDWSPGLVAALAFLAIGPSLVAYRCWGLGVSTVGPAIASFFANLTPAFAALLSALLLGELPRGYHVLAFVLIVAGIVVSSPRRARDDSEGSASAGSAP
ncbi:MAG: DMT family transporter [Burkholderiaceae bacterium]